MRALRAFPTIAFVGAITLGAITASISAYGATVEGSAGTSTDVLTPKAQAVCDGSFVLTAEAMAACTSKTWPAVLKDGSRFRNTGVGAEFNTLIRQLPTSTAGN